MLSEVVMDNYITVNLSLQDVENLKAAEIWLAARQEEESSGFQTSSASSSFFELDNFHRFANSPSYMITNDNSPSKYSLIKYQSVINIGNLSLSS